MKTVTVMASALLLVSGLVQASECDTTRGEKVFNKCVACHSLAEGSHMMGPSLHGILGRKAASNEGFVYSAALSQSGLTWDKQTLSDFLASPMTYVAGTAMPFRGIKKAEDRNAVICLLESKG